MKTNLRYALAFAAASLFFVPPALGADGNPKAPPQDRKAGAPAPEAQQDRMKRCNATAKQKELKGDERRAFMSTCLKG